MRIHAHTSSRFQVLALFAVIGCGGTPGGELTLPDTPDGTVRAVMDGLVDHQPVVIWRAMPPSYQQDVVSLAANLADNIDPAVFDRAVAVARKGAVVLQSQKELILSTETVSRANADPEILDGFWEAYIHMLDAVLASELSTLEGLRNVDVEAFLSTTGATLMDRAASVAPDEAEVDSLSARLGALEATGVELVSLDGDLAIVAITPPGEGPVEVPMTRIEGRWVPTDLAAQWPGMVEQTNAKIDYLGSEDAAQTRVQLLFAIGMAEGFIDQIAEMETPEQLDDLIGGLLGNVMQTQGGQMMTEG